jgi:hypothetical protein
MRRCRKISIAVRDLLVYGTKRKVFLLKRSSENLLKVWEKL